MHIHIHQHNHINIHCILSYLIPFNIVSYPISCFPYHFLSLLPIYKQNTLLGQTRATHSHPQLSLHLLSLLELQGNNFFTLFLSSRNQQTRITALTFLQPKLHSQHYNKTHKKNIPWERKGNKRKWGRKMDRKINKRYLEKWI